MLAERRPTPIAAAAGDEAPPPGRPLDGITVVEFATIIAAPLATSMLADLGAKVVKVELIDGDPYRHLVAGGTPAAKTTAGKSSICIDLKQARDGASPRSWPHGRRRRAQRPARRARTARPRRGRPARRQPRAGVGLADRLRAPQPAPPAPSTHPCAGAATGGAGYQAGPALDAPCETLADVREISRQLMRANESNPDPNTSAVAAEAVLLALLARQRFGVGQAVHVNMLAANMYANADDALDYAGKPARPTCDPDLLGPAPGYRLYRTADGWLFLAVTATTSGAVAGRRSTGRSSPTTPGSPTPTPGPPTPTRWPTLLAEPLRGGPPPSGRSAARRRVAGVRADASTPGPFFAHDQQVLANDFAPECTHARFGTHRRWGPIVRVNGGSVLRTRRARRRAHRRDPRRARP